eukprot:TRINITY_DN4108_c0_g2_i1.p1 TRINITY_DN4108_c0_g2~~TRINITY_DN4108_c0_g2_i1.p1  ORF type:complete len:821 (+),score=72.19 TRINITY_DN4108_c0_g2_i1:71-2464(+)
MQTYVGIKPRALSFNKSCFGVRVGKRTCRETLILRLNREGYLRCVANISRPTRPASRPVQRNREPGQSSRVMIQNAPSQQMQRPTPNKQNDNGLQQSVQRPQPADRSPQATPPSRPQVPVPPPQGNQQQTQRPQQPAAPPQSQPQSPTQLQPMVRGPGIVKRTLSTSSGSPQQQRGQQPPQNYPPSIGQGQPSPPPQGGNMGTIRTQVAGPTGQGIPGASQGKFKLQRDYSQQGTLSSQGFRSGMQGQQVGGNLQSGRLPTNPQQIGQGQSRPLPVNFPGSRILSSQGGSPPPTTQILRGQQQQQQQQQRQQQQPGTQQRATSDLLTKFGQGTLTPGQSAMRSPRQTMDHQQLRSQPNAVTQIQPRNMPQQNLPTTPPGQFTQGQLQQGKVSSQSIQDIDKLLEQANTKGDIGPTMSPNVQQGPALLGSRGGATRIAPQGLPSRNLQQLQTSQQGRPQQQGMQRLQHQRNNIVQQPQQGQPTQTPTAGTGQAPTQGAGRVTPRTTVSMGTGTVMPTRPTVVGPGKPMMTPPGQASPFRPSPPLRPGMTPPSTQVPGQMQRPGVQPQVQQPLQPLQPAAQPPAAQAPVVEPVQRPVQKEVISREPVKPKFEVPEGIEYPKSIASKDRLLPINEDIRTPMVRLVSADQQQLGIFPTEEAMAMAQEQAVDLLLINQDGKPPVAKLLKYDKYKFEKEKAEREAKRKSKAQKVDTKELKLKPNTDTHDYDVRIKNAKKFLSKGDKVKVTLQFRGREIEFKDIARDMMSRFQQDVADVGAVETAPYMQGNNLVMILTSIAKKQ